MAQDLADRLPARAAPVQVPAVGTGRRPHRQPDLVGVEVPQHRVGRALSVELVEDHPNDPAGLLVGIEDHGTIGWLEIPERRGHDQVPAPGLIQLPRVHPLLEDMPFRFAHHPVEPEQQPVRILGRVEHPLRVGQ
nr:hypothetical protein [Fimbriiglobus ruber]